MKPGEWVMLLYWLPREPSTPRIAMWRRLKRLGVGQLGDGLVALPHDRRTREQLDWLAEQVIEAGGTATTWLARPTTAQAGEALAAQLGSARADEYRQVLADADAASGLEPAARRAAVRRLREELHRIGRRDYFPPPEADAARAAVTALAQDELAEDEAAGDQAAQDQEATAV